MIAGVIAGVITGVIAGVIAGVITGVVPGCPKHAIGRMPAPVTPHDRSVDSASHPARCPRDGNTSPSRFAVRHLF
jgi:TctA family transporter